MEPAAGRQHLRDQLGRAREALDRGEPAEALAAIERALQVDPDYLAAQALKERILRRPAAAAEAGSPASEPRWPATSAPAIASTEGVLRFEQRIRARRIEKRAEAARAALASGRMRDARAAIDEIAGIDRQHPAFGLLVAELEAHATRARRRRHLGPGVAAVVVFGASILVARYPGSPRISVRPPAAIQRQMPVARHDAAAAAPGTVVTDAPDATAAIEAPASRLSTSDLAGRTPQATTANPARPVSTAGTTPPPSSPAPADRSDVTGAGPAPAEPAPSDAPRNQPDLPQFVPIEPSEPAQLPGALTSGPEDARARSAERTSDALSVLRPIARPPVVVPVRDEDLVLRTLQQYRRAYDTLDARAAQAVWPGVDGAALQRAFDGLLSQRLTFQSCQLQVNGSRASATCRGSARYTPRVGSSDARDEPRDWRFTLRKGGNDQWQIESARVAR